MDRKTLMTGLVAIGLALGASAASVAASLGPAHTTALVFKMGDLPSRTTLEYGWVGVGGDENFTAMIGGDDCADLDGANGNPNGQQPLFVQVQWSDEPPIGIKQLGQNVALLPANEVRDPAIDEACDQAGAATGGLVGTSPEPDFPPSDPQRIGHGDIGIRFEDVWFPTMVFTNSFFAISATAVSCQVEQSASSPQFTNEVNRGVAEDELITPSESLAGSSLTQTCVDQTGSLGAGWDSGTVNIFGGGLSGPTLFSCDTSVDPDCGDMSPGLWATCISALIVDPTTATQGTESDYTWWWVEDPNLALAGQWSNPANWDGEDWRDGHASQQPCETLGVFEA